MLNLAADGCRFQETQEMKTSRLSRYRIRIREILNRQGWKGLARFLFQRIVWRQWHSIVLKDPVGTSRRPSTYPEGIRFSYWLCHRELPDDVRRLLLAAGANEFLAELDDWDGLWILQAGDGTAVAWGGIYPNSFQAKVLRLPPGAVLLGGNFVVPTFRGKGLHRLALNDIALRLAQHGCRELFAEVRPDNIASLRGLEGARFVRVREVCLRILFRRVVLGHRGVRWA